MIEPHGRVDTPWRPHSRSLLPIACPICLVANHQSVKPWSRQVISDGRASVQDQLGGIISSLIFSCTTRFLRVAHLRSLQKRYILVTTYRYSRTHSMSYIIRACTSLVTRGSSILVPVGLSWPSRCRAPRETGRARTCAVLGRRTEHAHSIVHVVEFSPPSSR